MKIYQKILLFFALLLCMGIVAFCFFYENTQNRSAFAVLKQFSEEELLLFSDIAFNRNGYLHRWETDIRVQIMNKHELTQADINDVDSCIAILAPLVYPVRMERVESGGNFLVHTRTNEPLPTTSLSPMTPGFARLKLGATGFPPRHSIVRVKTFDTYRPGHRRDILLHEMLHGIGLHHPERSYPFYLNMALYTFRSTKEMDSILDLHFPISKQEKTVIRMMYSSGIRSGISRKQFLRKMGMENDW